MRVEMARETEIINLPRSEATANKGASSHSFWFPAVLNARLPPSYLSVYRPWPANLDFLTCKELIKVEGRVINNLPLCWPGQQTQQSVSQQSIHRYVGGKWHSSRYSRLLQVWTNVDEMMKTVRVRTWNTAGLHCCCAPLNRRENQSSPLVNFM